MSPEWLIAEGHMPGRPSLLGQRIEIRATAGSVTGVVKHEDASGIIYKDNFTGREYSRSYPFNYKVIEDAPGVR